MSFAIKSPFISDIISLPALFLNSLYHYFVPSNNNHKLYFGICMTLAYGPGNRTRGLISQLTDFVPSRTVYYAQSGMPPFYLFFFILAAKLHPGSTIIYNQNGIYHSSWSKYYKLKSFAHLFAAFCSDYTIFQSSYCRRCFAKYNSRIFSFVYPKSTILHNVPFTVPSSNLSPHSTLSTQVPHKVGLFFQSKIIDSSILSHFLSMLSSSLPPLTDFYNISHKSDVSSSNHSSIPLINYSYTINPSSNVHPLSFLDFVIYIVDHPACPNMLLEIISLGVPVISIGKGSLSEFAFPSYLHFSSSIRSSLTSDLPNFLFSLDQFLFRISQSSHIFAETSSRMANLSSSYVSFHKSLF